MKLRELYNIDSDVEITGVEINSKTCKQGDIFVCVSGATADRHDYIDDAIDHGVSAVVVSKDVGEKSVPIIKVDNTDDELPKLCQKVFDYPNQKLKMIGVTGTDGKTSVSTIIQTLLGDDICGYIGTNGISSKNVHEDNPNTTPAPNLLYKVLGEFYDTGCKYASIEASSEAFFNGRLKYLEFDAAILTNVTSEHLNTHGTFENYLDCKLNLFRQTKEDGICVVNKDDEHADAFIKEANGRVVTYGKDKDNTLVIDSFEIFKDHTEINSIYNDETIFINSPMLGDFNVYNLAAAFLTLLELGINRDHIMNNIKNISVNGRLAMIDTHSNYYVMVDYAHTPNGIYNLLNFVKTLKLNSSIVVIGQAGERDAYKRPEVGKVVLENADYAIFTYEDPRSEDPAKICEDIVRDIKDKYQNYEIVIDRKEAINKAINMAKENDIVLILGKGNETYQKLKDKVIHFNDIEEAKLAINNRNNKNI